MYKVVLKVVFADDSQKRETYYCHAINPDDAEFMARACIKAHTKGTHKSITVESCEPDANPPRRGRVGGRV